MTPDAGTPAAGTHARSPHGRHDPRLRLRLARARLRAARPRRPHRHARRGARRARAARRLHVQPLPVREGDRRAARRRCARAAGFGGGGGRHHVQRFRRLPRRCARSHARIRARPRPALPLPARRRPVGRARLRRGVHAGLLRLRRRARLAVPRPHRQLGTRVQARRPARTARRDAAGRAHRPGPARAGAEHRLLDQVARSRLGPAAVQAAAPGARPVPAVEPWPQPAAPWHFLYFLPLPQGQGSLRPGVGAARRGAVRGAWSIHHRRSACSA